LEQSDPTRERWCKVRRASRALLSQFGFLPPLELATGEEREALRTFWLDGALIAAGGAFLGSYLPLFVIAMGASGEQVGWLSSLSSLGNLFGCLVAGRYIAAVGGAKRAAFFSSRLVEVGSALVFAAMPFFVRPGVAVWAAIALGALRAAALATGVGAWNIFAGQVVPIRLRGRYFGSRNLIKALMAVIFVPVAGKLITATGGYPRGYQLCFVMALPILLLSAFMFARVPLKPAQVRGDVAQAGEISWWHSRRFLRFVAAASVWNLGATVVGPFYAVFMARQLGLGADAIGLLSTVSTAATVLGYIYWGPRTDRRGSQWALGWGAAVSACVPWLWLLVRSPWTIAGISAFGGFAAGGMGIALMNRLLEVMPSPESAPAMSAYLVAQGAAGIVGSLIGGYLFDRHGLMGPALVAGVCLLVGAALFAFLRRPAVRRTAGQRA
jgi:MFS family permease